MREPYPVIVALDGMSEIQAIELARQLSGKVWGFKVHTLVTQYGPGIIKLLKPFGKVFWDAKFHDIPSTTAAHVRAALTHDPDLISVHSDGDDGEVRLRAAITEGGTRVIAITELTSVGDGSRVPALAERAHRAGVSFVVCSPHEARVVRSRFTALTIVTPGISKDGKARDDQRRTMTAPEALAEGADLVVIGRPITKSADPTVALCDLLNPKP